MWLFSCLQTFYETCATKHQHTNNVLGFEGKCWYIPNQLSSRSLMMGRRWHFALKEAEERRGGQKRMLTGNDTKQNSSNGMCSTLANVCTGRRVLANGYVAASVSIWWGPAWESGSRSKFTSELFSFPSLGSFPIPFPFHIFPFSLPPPPTGPG